MKGQTCLETGCGRGGGLNYIMNIMTPERIMGTDISGQCVSFRQKIILNRLNSARRTGASKKELN